MRRLKTSLTFQTEIEINCKSLCGKKKKIKWELITFSIKCLSGLQATTKPFSLEIVFQLTSVPSISGTINLCTRDTDNR